ncbi:hypothetical protein L596_026733 [Steinernema carpocapsae]|uniref:Uncharacterized protein n=1 Tax=Steinernema carpocapsae TaxID=34508 RepID=A0A4U5M277_STECR|nr:hypothetical protein L596_026733 [Steinernema carpocapsae]
MELFGVASGSVGQTFFWDTLYVVQRTECFEPKTIIDFWKELSHFLSQPYEFFEHCEEKIGTAYLKVCHLEPVQVMLVKSKTF